MRWLRGERHVRGRSSAHFCWPTPHLTTGGAPGIRTLHRVVLRVFAVASCAHGCPAPSCTLLRTNLLSIRARRRAHTAVAAVASLLPWLNVARAVELGLLWLAAPPGANTRSDLGRLCACTLLLAVAYWIARVCASWHLLVPVRFNAIGSAAAPVAPSLSARPPSAAAPPASKAPQGRRSEPVEEEKDEEEEG